MCVLLALLRRSGINPDGANVRASCTFAQVGRIPYLPLHVKKHPYGTSPLQRTQPTLVRQATPIAQRALPSGRWVTPDKSLSSASNCAFWHAWNPIPRFTQKLERFIWTLSNLHNYRLWRFGCAACIATKPLLSAIFRPTQTPTYA